jgi:hypothetical protein
MLDGTTSQTHALKRPSGKVHLPLATCSPSVHLFPGRTPRDPASRAGEARHCPARQASPARAGRRCPGRHMPVRAMRLRTCRTACHHAHGRGFRPTRPARSQRRSLAVGRCRRPCPLSTVCGPPRRAAGHDRNDWTPLRTLVSTTLLRCAADAASGLRQRTVHTAFTPGGAPRHLCCLRSLNTDTSRGRPDVGEPK